MLSLLWVQGGIAMPDERSREPEADRRARYRRNEVRRLGNNAPTAETRAAFLKIAAFWDEMANESEPVH